MKDAGRTNLLDSDIPSPLFALGRDDDMYRVSLFIWFNERHFSAPVSAEVACQVLPSEDGEPVVDTVPLGLRQLQGEQVQPDE